MKKSIENKNIYFTIEWSDFYYFDRHAVLGIPAMPGIVHIAHKKEKITDLIVYSCWRNGLRLGIRNLLDPFSSEIPVLLKYDQKKLIFRYCVVDSNLPDHQDILFWLIKEYNPLHNKNDFEDSKRFIDIYVKEEKIKNQQTSLLKTVSI